MEFGPGRDLEDVALAEREERGHGSLFIGLRFGTLLARGIGVGMQVAGQVGFVPGIGPVAVFVVFVVVGAWVRFRAQAAVFEMMEVVKCSFAIEEVAG